MSNVKELPKTGFAPSNEDIAKHLREQADWIQRGDYDDVRNVYMVIEKTDGSIVRVTMGRICDLARMIGVLTVASIRAAMVDE